MSSEIGLALLGAGIFVREQHLPAVISGGVFKIKAIYSRSRASVDNLQQEAHTLGSSGHIDSYYDVDGDKPSSHEHSLDSLLARSDIEAVIIALPILKQPEVIHKALKSGKHVLCEKPIAGTVDDGVKVIEDYIEIKKSNPKLIFSIAENFRYERSFRHVHEAVSSGKIGKVRFFSKHFWANVNEDNKYYQTSWRKDPKYQGGFLLDGGVHYVAALRLAVGAPIESISAFTRLNKEILAPVDTFHSTLRLTDGTTGTFSISFASTLLALNLTVVGEKGSIVVEGSREGNKVVVTVGDESEEKTFSFEGVKKEIEAFGHAVKAGHSEHFASPVEALIDLAVVEAALSSGEKGGHPVNIPTFEHLKI